MIPRCPNCAERGIDAMLTPVLMNIWRCGCCRQEFRIEKEKE